VRCPICNAEIAVTQSAAVPFCSERCRILDLGRWLDEGYSLLHVPDPEEEELPEQPPEAKATMPEPQ
jgi:uncharacterized protein